MGDAGERFHYMCVCMRVCVYVCVLVYVRARVWRVCVVVVVGGGMTESGRGINNTVEAGRGKRGGASVDERALGLVAVLVPALVLPSRPPISHPSVKHAPLND